MCRCRPGLTVVGFGWSLLSLLAADAVCVGFYRSDWVQGVVTVNKTRNSATVHSYYFGCFRFCDYVLQQSPDDGQQHSSGCGRYRTFDDIPSVWWRVSTVLIGFGCGLAVLIALITIPAWFCGDVVSRSSARVMGIFQLLAAILICVGCTVYPLGWENDYIKSVCGTGSGVKVGSYVLGACVIGWPFYLTIGGACALFICASLSAVAGKPIQWQPL